MYDLYPVNIVFMTDESYDLKFVKNVIYDFCDYGKSILNKIFMTKVL